MAAAPELLARVRALKISQNALARGIDSDSGHVSRVLRGIVVSDPVKRRIEDFLTAAERRALLLRGRGTLGMLVGDLQFDAALLADLLVEINASLPSPRREVELRLAQEQSRGLKEGLDALVTRMGKGGAA